MSHFCFFTFPSTQLSQPLSYLEYGGLFMARPIKSNMKNLLLILPLLYVVSCSASFEDEYLLCKYNSYKSNLALTYDMESSMFTFRYKHTPDKLLNVRAIPEVSTSFVSEDVKGYRYFEDESAANGFIKHKYHPVFRDIESTVKQNH